MALDPPLKESSAVDIINHDGPCKHPFPNRTNVSLLTITLGFVLALLLAITHHLFLSYLHGRDIGNFSQFWVKNASNGFANVFSICMAYAATRALLQTK
ncbi:hypothetical protein M408DRAFT_202900 [Serendipita vermifera MAFF 305830]|uniref:Uncharacterized protein n=1 Tax=Serendipita vermifera MAFF 305830 TaxID=933852 RepID=A0A0C3B179_SERVB|nr:hypothetical protein M408DRAFT_202900 [Serendipita vermifera MAFF 305830]